MVVLAGMGFYHVGADNTSRIRRFSVLASGTIANAFLFLRGSNPAYPYTGQYDSWDITSSTSTVNDQIAQSRADFVVRYMCLYAIPIGISLASTQATNDTILIDYESYFANVLPSVNDITDTLGLAGQTPKVKSGLQTLANFLTNTANTAVSLDGGTTALFAVNPNQSNFTPSTAPAVPTLTVSLVF